MLILIFENGFTMVSSLKKLVTIFLACLFTVANAKSFQSVSFTTTDEATIFANYYPSGEHAVILAHGAIFNKESWEKLIPELTRNNFSVLAIDFRGYGQSTTGSGPNAKYLDILGAINFLNKQPDIASISVLGASMGGGAAAKASIHSKKGDIYKLILLSPMPVSNPEQLKGNILYIVSKRESIAKTIKKQFNKTPDPKKFAEIEGSAHAQHIFKTNQAKNLTKIIVDFLKADQ